MTFSFTMATTVRFGAGVLERADELLTNPRPERPTVLVVTDSKLCELGLAGKLEEALPRCETIVYSGVQANPLVGQVNEAAHIAQERDVAAIYGIGGGSSLDTAKAAAALASSDGERIEPYLFGEKALGPRRIPLAAVPTTAGTGSEVTPISVLTDPARDIKRPLVHESLFPDMAIVDPNLTHGLPAPLTASTGLDALSHALEALWSTGSNPISDSLGLDAAARILASLERAFLDGDDKEARREMSLASMLAGIAFGQTKTAGVHAVSFPLTHHHGVSHGTACAMVLAPFLRLNMAAKSVERKLDVLAVSLGLHTARDVTEKVEALVQSVGVPLSLGDVGIGKRDWPRIVEESLSHPNMGNNPVPVHEDTLEKMFEHMEACHATS